MYGAAGIYVSILVILSRVPFVKTAVMLPPALTQLYLLMGPYSVFVLLVNSMLQVLLKSGQTQAQSTNFSSDIPIEGMQVGAMPLLDEEQP